MAADNEIIILDDDQKEKKDQNDQNIQNEFEQDEFVLLEELAVAPAGSTQGAEGKEEAEQKGKKKLDKKMLIIIATGGGMIVLLLIVLIIVLLSRDSKKELAPEAPVTTMPRQEQQNYYEINKGRIEEMIAKANALYDSGNRIEALKIYENVAIYNESLSYYNLGVSQMNQEKF
ncbi:MAG: GTP pyrophosphokinase, partial [Campylobacter sp.]|nr:GTP pyrophosphokinase [Campylobacter sp.]